MTVWEPRWKNIHKKFILYEECEVYILVYRKSTMNLSKNYLHKLIIQIERGINYVAYMYAYNIL
jgi:hypothetical protein